MESFLVGKHGVADGKSVGQGTSEFRHTASSSTEVTEDLSSDGRKWTDKTVLNFYFY